mgnify:CR=1 FL=1|tara:strand:- start:291 stop:494 length:204 start_codon:yes stop_codon:yes gene_type:complete
MMREILAWALDYDDRCSESARRRSERMERLLCEIDSALDMMADEEAVLVRAVFFDHIIRAFESEVSA